LDNISQLLEAYCGSVPASHTSVSQGWCDVTNVQLGWGQGCDNKKLSLKELEHRKLG